MTTYTQAYKIAMAAATDAANRQARKNKRISWRLDDRETAVTVFYRVMAAQGYGIEECKP